MSGPGGLRQRPRPGALDEIAGKVKEAGVLRTAVITVGRTAGAVQFRDSHLYSPERESHPC